MKKNIFLIALFFAFTQISFAQVNWKADKMHTNVLFSIEHMGISFVDGEFTELEGEMQSQSTSDYDGATFNFTIQVNSIDTRVAPRDAHLLTDDFFNAAKYPEITFRNAKLNHKRGNKYSLTGDLTIRDVTKTVTFDATKNGQYTDKEGNVHVGFTAELTIDRTDYNINYGGTAPNGKPAVAKDVRIVVNTELVQQ